MFKFGKKEVYNLPLSFFVALKKSKRIEKDKKILKKFISIYCKENHLKKGTKEYKDGLCRECYELLEYAVKKSENCPLNPKPQCKHCAIHCYRPDMRQKIKKVMTFSSIWLIKKGRIDWIIHYFL